MVDLVEAPLWERLETEVAARPEGRRGRDVSELMSRRRVEWNLKQPDVLVEEAWS